MHEGTLFACYEPSCNGENHSNQLCHERLDLRSEALLISWHCQAMCGSGSDIEGKVKTPRLSLHRPSHRYDVLLH